MGSMSMWHWVIVLSSVRCHLGGRGKISELMGDMAKGIKAFKKGMSDEEVAKTEPAFRNRSRPSITSRPTVQAALRRARRVDVGCGAIARGRTGEPEVIAVGGRHALRLHKAVNT